jgi:hypothetical protein
MIQVLCRTEEFPALRPGGRGQLIGYFSKTKKNPNFFTPKTNTNSLSRYNLVKYDLDKLTSGKAVALSTTNLLLFGSDKQPQSEVFGDGYRFYLSANIMSDQDEGVYSIEINEFKTDFFELRPQCVDIETFTDSAGNALLNSQDNPLLIF